MLSSGIPIGQWSGSDSVNDLHRTIIENEKSNTRNTYIVFFMTFVSILIAAASFLLQLETVN